MMLVFCLMNLLSLFKPVFLFSVEFWHTFSLLLRPCRLPKRCWYSPLKSWEFVILCFINWFRPKDCWEAVNFKCSTSEAWLSMGRHLLFLLLWICYLPNMISGLSSCVLSVVCSWDLQLTCLMLLPPAGTWNFIWPKWLIKLFGAGGAICCILSVRTAFWCLSSRSCCFIRRCWCPFWLWGTCSSLFWWYCPSRISWRFCLLPNYVAMIVDFYFRTMLSWLLIWWRAMFVGGCISLLS